MFPRIFGAYHAVDLTGLRERSRLSPGAVNGARCERALLLNLKPAWKNEATIMLDWIRYNSGRESLYIGQMMPTDLLMPQTSFLTSACNQGTR